MKIQVTLISENWEVFANSTHKMLCILRNSNINIKHVFLSDEDLSIFRYKVLSQRLKVFPTIFFFLFNSPTIFLFLFNSPTIFFFLFLSPPSSFSYFFFLLWEKRNRKSLYPLAFLHPRHPILSQRVNVCSPTVKLQPWLSQKCSPTDRRHE